MGHGPVASTDLELASVNLGLVSFISGVFIPLSEMSSLARAVAYLWPLTYAQDLMNHAVLGSGLLSLGLDLLVLSLAGVLFLSPSLRLHQRGRSWGIDVVVARR